MNIADLEKLGGLVSEEPVIRKISWTHFQGEEEKTEDFEAGIVRLSFSQIEEIQKQDTNKIKTAEFISLCVRFPDDNGRYEQRLTYEQACRLAPTLAYALSTAIVETNNLDHKTKK